MTTQPTSTVPTDLDSIRSLLYDRRNFIERLLLIEDKQRHIRRFELNPIQSALYPYISAKGCRNVILKPSQVGLSTLVIADYLVDTITVPGTTSVVVAHEEFITQRLLRKAHFFYDNLHEQFKPKITHKSANEMLFPEINSVLYIGSARAAVFGRGEAIHNFLADEYAFWIDTARIMVPTLQRVPPEGRINVVSTPNGEDNDYHDLYQTAREGKTNWRALFFPWHAHPEYTLPYDSLTALSEDRFPTLCALTADEEELLSQGITMDQLRWRRSKITELDALRRDGSTRLLFGQEFPEDDTRCFMSAGDMVYDADLLSTLGRQCYPAPHVINDLQAWELPQPGANYVVSVDPGQGKTARSAITAWRFEPPQTGSTLNIPIHCATHASWQDPEATAKTVAWVGQLYNWATIIPEANSHGLAVISELKNAHKYPNLYRRRDFITGRPTADYGWLTTTRTKPFLIKEMHKHLPVFQCYDLQIIRELRGIRWIKGQAQALGLEDLHMSTIIAIGCQDAAFRSRGFAGAGGWDQSWGR